MTSRRHEQDPAGDGAKHDASAAWTGLRSRPFLSIWFRCCHVYGRIYRNASSTAYEGRCPRCGAGVHASIGPHGTSRRAFEAR